MQLIILIMQ